MKSLLQNNNIEKYTTHNQGKYFIAERFTRTLKNKIYQYLKIYILVNKMR